MAGIARAVSQADPAAPDNRKQRSIKGPPKYTQRSRWGAAKCPRGSRTVLSRLASATMFPDTGVPRRHSLSLVQDVITPAVKDSKRFPLTGKRVSCYYSK